MSKWLYHPEIRKRRPEFEKLLDKLMKLHKITDRDALALAVDGAMRTYHDHRSGLLKVDKERLRQLGQLSPDELFFARQTATKPLEPSEVKQFVKSIATVIEVLSCGDNTIRIAHLLLGRADLLIHGKSWNRERTLSTIRRLERITHDLSVLKFGLRGPTSGRARDEKLHLTVALLERYWRSPYGKKRGKLKFFKSIIAFIDRRAAAKVTSTVRHRLAKKVAV